MSVLTHEAIEKLILEENLIENYSMDSIEGASYDLKLGAKYYKNDESKEIIPPDASIILEPGEFALLTSYEKINMPLNLIGHNGLMSKWTKQGLLSLFSPQIDPGFQGILFVPVYNAGDRTITIPVKDKIFTIEFVKTHKKAKYGWSDPSRHGVQNEISIPIGIPRASKPILSNLNSLENKINLLESNLSNLKEQIDKTYNSKIANTSIILAVLAMLIAVFPTIKDIVKDNTNSSSKAMHAKKENIQNQDSNNTYTIKVSKNHAK